MRIVEAGYTIPEEERAAIAAAPGRIERAARVCYASKGSTGPAFVSARIKQGHLAVLRHATFGVLFTCSRSCAQQLLRHAHLDAMQESQRFVRYRELEVIRPFNGPPMNGAEELARAAWSEAMRECEAAYGGLLLAGYKPEVARSVLPQCTATRVWVSTNVLEWRHIFAARCSEKAEPEIQRLCCSLLDELNTLQPCLWEGMEQGS